jgi:hypothetical protein
MRRVLVALLPVVVVAGVIFSAPVGAATTKQFCAAYKKFVLAYGVPFNAGNPTAEQIAAVQPELDALIDTVQTTAPPAIADETQLMADQLHAGFGAIVANPDPAFFYDAFDAADQWAIKHCGYKVITVTADDFTLRGIPKTASPGFVAFNIKNVAPDQHTVVIIRATGSETAAELAALPLAEALKKVEVIASGVTIDPGKTTVNYAAIKKPGRYAAVDPEHLGEKMYAEFTVKKP